MSTAFITEYLVRRLASQAGWTVPELFNRVIASDPALATAPTTSAGEVSKLAALLDELVIGAIGQAGPPHTAYGGMEYVPRDLMRTLDEQRAMPDGGIFSRGDLTHMIRLTARVDHAAILLSSAFSKAGIGGVRRKGGARTAATTEAGAWYAQIVNTTLERLEEVRIALLHPWTADHLNDPLVFGAFVQLADLTPARPQLMDLFRADRPRAIEVLGKQLQVISQEFVLTARLAADIDKIAFEEVSPAEQFEASFDALLQDAGELLSLTDAAKRLGVSRQALHQRIQKGSALGFMREGEIVVPSIQFVVADGKTTIVPELKGVLEPFLSSKAGVASALQFLLDHDPVLDSRPIDALKAGQGAKAAVAAEAYLGLGEG